MQQKYLFAETPLPSFLLHNSLFLFMRTRELRQKSIGELEKLLQEKRTKILDAHFALQSGQNKKVHELKDAKKDIARILTLLREQQ